MKDLSGFDWGWMNGGDELANFHKENMIQEIFVRKQYEQFYKVKEGDVVVDIGASVGPFTYSIIDKNPKQVYCIEPDKASFEIMKKNLPNKNIININAGISYKSGLVPMELENQVNFRELKNTFNVMTGITFEDLIKDNNIDHINFLKIDCEGGEYDIFNNKNMEFLINNVDNIVGEYHLSTPILKTEFRYFRDKYLRHFKNIEVRAVCGTDIKWRLWNDDFVDFYNQIIIHINNE